VTNEPEQPSAERKPLRMVECGSCRAKIFISGDLKPLESVPCTRCGHPVCMPLQLRQFELRSVIASGGMGTVYRAFDLSLHRMVAVKMLRKDMDGDEEVLAGFYREARATASLNHTNIIHIYSFDEIDGQPFLVMELADHDSLDKWIERDGRLPELAVLDIGTKVASALDTALKHNLLHRDIKPANILFNEDKEPKLVDFGLARVAAEEQAQYESTIWATPYYVAPEKIRREMEDFQSDMYSLAGTLYHAITGRVPFDAPTVEELILAHVNQPLVPPIEVVPEISQATSDALAQAMAKKPSGRFRTYDEFIMALTASRSQLLISRYVGEEPPPEEAPPEEAPPPEQGKTGWWRR
jgi:eukaryotic-like serine/threonine-protein kinase